MDPKTGVAVLEKTSQDWLQFERLVARPEKASRCSASLKPLQNLALTNLHSMRDVFLLLSGHFQEA